VMECDKGRSTVSSTPCSSAACISDCAGGQPRIPGAIRGSSARPSALPKRCSQSWANRQRESNVLFQVNAA
jgi:hypothetical protein